ncbi:perforin-1-like [Clarias gariepinus]|uniref:perforin-1-like n=1 Tax=Clarias gariepinus TaxID=13013 RepID=UPI00234C1DAC|nr:perforin-1-like [Clarias gariepinus]
MLRTLLIGVVFATTLAPTSQQCIKAHHSQCANAEFIPGFDLAGEGFDITKMQRKGAYVFDMSVWLKKDETCTLCKNSNIGGKEQKLPVSVVDWRPQSCNMKLSSSVYHSSEDLINSSTSSIENDWKSDLQIMVKQSEIIVGSHSKLAEYSMKKTKEDKFSFATHSVSCGYYSYRVSSTPVMHPELLKELRGLPKCYGEKTKQRYFDFIDKFGTHYFRQVTLGGEVRSVTSIKACQASLQGLSVDEVKMCLDIEVTPRKGPSADFQNKANHCKRLKQKVLNEKSFACSFNERETNVIGGHNENIDLLFSSNTDPKAYEQWVSSVPAHPDVISYSLEPLHKLEEKENIRENLRKAIKDYIVQRALIKDCSSPCKAGRKSNPKEPCSCTCHNNPGVAFNCCPTQKGYAKVTVTAIRATGLFGDFFGNEADAYVKIFRNDNIFAGKTPVVWNRNQPTWNYDFSFDNDDLNQFKSVTLQVWDEDSGWNDDLLGECKIKLKSGLTQDTCSLNHGTLYYKVIVKCIPALTGSLCMEYQPTPMDAQLEKVYVSRNARPIPISVLLEMGVLLDERIPRFNQTNIPKATGFEL